jgi:uncharacterized protein (TIGR01244 family)
MFKSLTDGIFVAPQISESDVTSAAAAGIKLIINNRPEGESDDQIPGPVIEAAARALGLDYVAIPINHSGFSQPQVQAMAQALDGEEGAVLAYCRSGTRSTLLWALAEASQGGDISELSALADDAGYDVTPVRPLMELLKAQV